MDLKLTKGEPVKVEKNPTNVWRFHLTSMSGDADNYETQTHTTDNNSDIIKYIRLFSSRWLMSKKGLDMYSDSAVIKHAVEIGKELGLDSDTVHDLWCDMVGYDVTCEGCYASPDEIWVTYFDENGIEHKVDVEIDGKPIKYNINEGSFR